MISGAWIIWGNMILKVSSVLLHSHEDNYMGSTEDVYPWYEFENYLFKITTEAPRGH